ncbi:MAG: universal stress protein [Halobacteria archaeon]|nr:universal stress protein [Halobacteria archaeon]
MYDNILVPTDGSEGADRAVDYALELAELSDSKIHILFVIDEMIYEHPWVGENLDFEAMEEAAKDDMRDMIHRATEKDLESVAKVKVGYPPDEIIEYAEEKDIDIIVMGYHGEGGAEEHLIGGTTKKVLSNSKIPVLPV